MAKTLTVYLAADLKKFSSGLNTAERQVSGFGGTLKNVMGPALIGAGIAAGAFATKLAVDGVQAAIEDEAAVAKLAQTLQNLGLAHDTQPVEDYIYQLERSLGIADTELRPAYDRLVRSIGDTEKANDALALALDVSAGTGKSLEQVVEALGKAYDGNISGLSRLGAGIDAATIRTGDMELITRKLSDTFAGQATVQAGTFEGQIDRLSTAADNMKEAFGAGLLGALGDTNDATQGLVDAMEDLEPYLKDLGTLLGTTVSTAAGEYTKMIDEAGESTEELAQRGEGIQKLGDIFGGFLAGIGYAFTGPNSPLGAMTKGLGAANDGAVTLSTGIYRSAVAAERAVPGFQAVTSAIDDIGAESVQSAFQVASMAEALAAVGGNTFNWRREVSGATDDAEQFSIDLNWNAYQARRAAAAAAEAAAANKSYGGSTSSAIIETDKLTKAQKRLTDAYEAQNDALDDVRRDLTAAMEELDKATDAWDNYFDGIAGGLQKGLDLAAAYEGQFSDTGEATGVSLLEGFNRQVAHVEWFANVLDAMKRQGADSRFISEIASLGPGIGGALGEQLVEDGLVKTLSDKWIAAQTLIDQKAAGLVPTFLTTGKDAAMATVDGLAQQVDAESKNLTKLGRQIGKPVGAGFKAQIAADVLEAVRAVEAAQTAARAERVAQETARQQAITEQQVAQAVAQTLARNDARTGRPVGGAMGIVFT